MHDVVGSQIVAAQIYLVDDGAPLKLIFLFQIFLKIAALAVLHDEVAVVVGVEDVDELDDVGVVEFLDDGHLVVQEVDAAHAHLLEADDLDGIPGALIVVANALVDASAEARSYHMFEVEAISPDAFLSLVLARHG
jgi:hypothetical protein